MTFSRYIGIDYSGAETPEQSLSGLRVYSATGADDPAEVPPPPSPRKYWSRRELTEWLIDELHLGPRTIVGIDHAFSFPWKYFEHHQVRPEWPWFLDDFAWAWPTDRQNMYVDFIRDGTYGNGSERLGDRRWLRIVDARTRAISPFDFECPGSVAKATHAGLPLLRYIRYNTLERVHFWPFDGWEPRSDASVVTEVYPALWNGDYPRGDRNAHQHDAYVTAKWMQQMDHSGDLSRYFTANLPGPDRSLASIEGWILGVAPALTQLR